MKNILGAMFGIWLISMMIYGPVYLLFFNSTLDAVKDYSIEDLLFDGVVLITDRKEELKEKKKFAKDFVSTYKKNSGVDLSVPIFSILKKSKDVSDLSAKKVMDFADGEAHVISFKYKDNFIKINFAVKRPSFLDMKTAKAICLEPTTGLIAVLSELYKIPYEDVLRISSLIMIQLPPN